MNPSSFLGTPITRDYKPGLLGASSRAYDHRGVLTWGDVEAMKRDPQIAFGLRILYAPLPQVKWKVKAKDKAVAAYVDRLIQKIWTNHLPDLLDCVCYGHSGGEVIWKHDEQTDLIELDRIDPVLSPDLRPLQKGRELAGIAVQGVTDGDGGPGWIQTPRSLWVVHEQIPGSLYGRSRLRAVWQPWQEKTGRHGALDVRRLWFVKNVFRGGIIRHPAGTIETAPGVFQSCQDYARELVEKMESGGVLTLPNLTDDNGNQLWTYEEPKVNGDLTGVRDYTQDLDRETLVALGIPPEVVDAAESGSGWSGRSVPFLVWLSSEDQVVACIVKAIVEQVARPGVCVNFGEQWFEVEPESLVPKGMADDAAQAEGGQEQGQEQGQGDGEDLLGTAGGLQAIVAVQQSVYSGQLPREAGVALAKEVMGLDGEAAERLFPLIPEKTQPAPVSQPPAPSPAPEPAPAPVSMSMDWSRYEGPAGGRGWKNTRTGEVRYQEADPGGSGGEKPGEKPAAGGEATGEAVPAEKARATLVKQLLGVPAAAATTAKQVAERVTQPVWARLSPKSQERLLKAFKVGKAIEHKAMIAFSKGKELSVEVARERGLGEEHAERVGKIVAVADQVLAWTTTFPVVTAATGNPAVGKVASFLPMASLGYLAMSAARNPLAMWRAAKTVFSKKHAAEEPVQMSLDAAGADREAIAALLAGMAKHEGDARDWYEALVYQALDETGDLAEAVELADEYVATNPTPPPEDGGDNGDNSEVAWMSQDAAGDNWVPYVGKLGKRKGQSGWKNKVSGRVAWGNKPTARTAQAAKPAAQRPKVQDVAAKIKALRESGKATPEGVRDLADQLMSLTVRDIQALKKAEGVKGGKNKADLVAKIKEYVAARGDASNPNAPAKEAPRAAEPGAGDGAGGPGTGEAPAATGGPVAEATGGSASGSAGEGGDAGGESARARPAERVPASTGEVGRRLGRFESFFRARGQHQVADWVTQLKDHVNAVGAESALAALNPSSEGLGKKGEDVQYWGVGTEEANWKNMGSFIESYLSRNGIVTVTGDTSDPNLPLVSALGAPDKYVAGQDFKPSAMHYTDKLTEAKDLPGLETSEDISKLVGKEVTHLTQEVTDKLDATYGKGQWIVKCYDDNAAAGYGIFFPQRAAAIAQDAKNTIWNAGAALARYGFQLARDPDTKKVVGLVHSTGDTYAFGSEEYQKTIDGDARQWADRAAAAAQHEQGAMLPEGSFMAQPAFKAVGISDAERAAGKTWHEKNEGRVHLVTRADGNVEVIPHSTWLKGGNLPVVFEDEDTKAMAEAARDAIAKLPPEARKGQVYAPDIMKTADGYRVVELNAQGDNNGSGYLHDNHFTIDAYTSYLTGRQPAHVQFIRQLLTSRKSEK